MSRLLRTLALAVLVCGVFAANASAYWTSSGSGSGSGTTATMPTGATPTVSVAGTTVTVSFSQVNIVGAPIGSLVGGGYEVRRQPANGGAAVTPGGACGAVITGGAATLSCTETATPRGDWRYTVRPILYGWTGGTSATSAVALVLPDAPTAPVATLAPAADINVGWTAGAGATGYNVYRRTPPTAFNFTTPLNGATPVATTSYADGSPVNGTAYVYVIRSVVIGSAGQQIESASSTETASVTADGTAPTAVSITNPGTPLAGTITLNGAATDAQSGIASVAFQYKTSAGAVWTTACTDTATPFTCSFNTTSVADGNYDFRVIATDNAGNTTTSAAVTARTIDNTGPTGVTITAPPAIITGTITINAGTPTDPSGIQSVAIQRSPAGTGTWTTICTDNTAAYSCAFNSTAVADGLYDFRALATDNLGNASNSATVTNRRIDNTAPTIAPINPGTWVSGLITLGGTAADGAGSGLASLVLEGRAVGDPGWVGLATGTNSVSITYDTTGLADNDYEVRLIATDNAGFSTTTVVTPINVDNTDPATAAVTDPATNLSDTVTVNATGTDAFSGVQSITIQRSPAGAGTWTTICTDNAAAYSCAWDTTAVGDGLYDLRAIVTDNAGNTTTSATVANRRVDNTAPTGVTIAAPPATIAGTITINAGTPTDTGSGVQSVAIQRSPAGAGTWTTICTDNTAAYSCAFNSTAAADGFYDFRALATDNAGNTAASTTSVNHRIDNSGPTTILAAIASPQRGTLNMSATATDAGSVTNVQFQRSPAGAGVWTTICTDTTPTYDCASNTTSVADGLYDFRALATDNLGNLGTSVQANIRIDNTAPTALLGAMATPENGTVTLTSASTDGGSGVASVVFQRSPAGAGTWTTICTDNAAAFDCAFNTTSVADGLYDFRTVATDVAGNTANSAVQTNIRIDNTSPTATLGAITPPINQAYVMNGTAADGGSGIANVQFQRSPVGAGTWTTICTDNATPFTCTLGAVATGLYDFRALATDVAGNTGASTIQSSVQVDNTAPTAADIQTINGGTANRPTAGDQIVYTFSEAMQPTSFLAGWTGASQAVRVRLTQAGGGDTMTVRNTADTAQLPFGSVAIGTAYVTVTANFNATMVMTGSTIVVTLGAQINGTVGTSAANNNMVWTPSTAVTDLAGNAMAATARTETGAADPNF